MAGITTKANFPGAINMPANPPVPKEIDYEALTWELMTLLDSIEVESEEGYEDPAVLARQRFDILEKYGLKPEFGQIVSARKQ